MMKIRFAFLLLLLSCMASAQYTRGYFYVGPGGATSLGNTQSTYLIGGGAERLLVHGIGAGFELGGLLPAQAFTSNAAGIVSLNGYYHFLHDRALDPFATMGYSLLFRDYTANMFNFGGGVNYWFQDNLGLLLEFRDHVRHYDVAGPANSVAVNYWNFRIGLTFR